MIGEDMKPGGGDDDGTGHLKYHQRNRYDSVPQGGFEMTIGVSRSKSV